jgi:hypothetical protein
MCAVAAAGVEAPTSDGVRFVVRPDRAPPFRDVQGRLSDPELERSLFCQLRDEPVDVAHFCGFGGAMSHLAPWLVDRLGVPAIVVADPVAETLCHRLSLVDATGAPCGRWDDANRCRECASAPTPDGLTRGQAFSSRLLRWLGGLSPYPATVDFLNRLDMVVFGLTAARLVLVADEESRALLERAGVPSGRIAIGIPAPVDAAGWVRVYESAIAGRH